MLLSGRNEPAAQACERILLESGIDTTVVRCSFFAQNFSEHFLVDAVVEGVIALPAGDVREPIIDVDDIAEVAVKALTEDGHAGRVHELTGPRLLSFHDVGRRPRARRPGARSCTCRSRPSSTSSAPSTAGFPPRRPRCSATLFAQIFDGRSESLTDGVAAVLGRPARDFADFAAAAAAAGAWSTDRTR